MLAWNYEHPVAWFIGLIVVSAGIKVVQDRWCNRGEEDPVESAEE